jgi:hypothetical protein
MGERKIQNIPTFFSSHSWGRWPEARGGEKIAKIVFFLN